MKIFGMVIMTKREVEALELVAALKQKSAEAVNGPISSDYIQGVADGFRQAVELVSEKPLRVPLGSTWIERFFRARSSGMVLDGNTVGI